MKQPLSFEISVVIVTRNRKSMLLRAIKSIGNGTMLPGEIIVIDNNSDDDTKEAVFYLMREEYTTIRYHFVEKIGISAARNKGLEVAQNSIIAFTDDDCVVDSHWVERVVQAHHEMMDVVAIGGRTENFWNNTVGLAGHLFRSWITQNDVVCSEDKNVPIYPESLGETMVYSLATQNISYKKDMINGFWFDEKLSCAEAIDYSWRLLKEGKFTRYVPSILVYHEYRDQLFPFVLQCWNYGKSFCALMEKSRKQSFFPDSKKRKRIVEFYRYFRFCLQAVNYESIGLLRKLYLFFLMMVRELIFYASFYYHRFLCKNK